MLYHLLYPLREVFSAFNIMQYITFRAAYAAVTALLFSFLLGPWVIRKLRELKFGQEIRQDGPQSHLHKAGTPTMGGVLMILSVVASILLWMDLTKADTWIVVLAVLGFGAVGFADDILKILGKKSEGLTPWMKTFGQLLVAALIAIWLILLDRDYTTALYLPFLKNPVLDMGPIFYFFFAVFWLVGFSNAVNLTDGLDGLATGLMIITALALAVISYVSGHVKFAEYLQIPFVPGGGELTILCLALVGAAVGFLWFNAHPAEVFMGDSGSLAFGGLLATIALLLKKEILLVILMGVFVIETASVIIQVFWYKRTKTRVFKMAPLHHHFELSGWDETKVVIRFWILGGLFAILSLSTLKIQ